MIQCWNQSGLISGIWPVAVRDGFGLASSIEFVNHNFREQAQHFHIEDDLSTFGLKEHLLFPEQDRIAKFIFRNRKTDKILEIKNLSEQDVCGIGNCLEVLSRSQQIPVLCVACLIQSSLKL